MCKVFLVIAAFLAMNSLTVLAQSSFPPGISPTKFHLYVLAGQSNMAGRGTVETVDKTPHPRVWVLNRANQWVPATDPLHFDKPDVIGVGPGLAFGKLMATQDTTVFIGLIPTAAGGSAIDAWQPGGYHEQTHSHPYDEAIKRVQLAQKTGTLHGILWHQGESDSKPEQAAVYEQKLKQLINRFRQVLSAPAVPVVVGTLGDFYVAKNPAGAQINNILRALPRSEPHVACVDASGLTDKGDQTHFDAASARELGRRYAEAMQVLERTGK
ncbi:sialate O-acetylesterase [Spirosoma endbachense]|uniref:Sialate O-acetylesterase n=1 Tax=Spirosoma endbachense TaxID=2666025 RepID=A0A6P1W402_9BACT|nr:sialate O-acetylesterase [Spirosoma endbachense]QHV98739.1 sialate O-acetylesterase [Spirosoma endbachense]